MYNSIILHLTLITSYLLRSIFSSVVTIVRLFTSMYVFYPTIPVVVANQNKDLLYFRFTLYTTCHTQTQIWNVSYTVHRTTAKLICMNVKGP